MAIWTLNDAEKQAGIKLSSPTSPSPKGSIWDLESAESFANYQSSIKPVIQEEQPVKKVSEGPSIFGKIGNFFVSLIPKQAKEEIGKVREELVKGVERIKIQDVLPGLGFIAPKPAYAPEPELKPIYPKGKEPKTEIKKEERQTIEKLQKDYENSLIGKFDDKFQTTKNSFIRGLTGGIIKPKEKVNPDLADKIIGSIAEISGTALAIGKIGAVFDGLLLSSKAIQTFFNTYPRLSRYVYPLIKNAVSFSAYGQLDPDLKDRLNQLKNDITTSVPFTALGFISKARYSIPASFGLGYGMAKLHGATNEDAFVSGGVLAVLDAWGRAKGQFKEFVSGRKTDKILKIEAARVINQYSDIKIKPNDPIEKINEAYRSASKKVHPDIIKTDAPQRAVNSAYEFLVGKSTKLNLEVLKEKKYTPQEIINEVVKNGLDKTDEGKKIIKAALEAENKGSDILITKAKPEFKPTETKIPDVITKELEERTINKIQKKISGFEDVGKYETALDFSKDKFDGNEKTQIGFISPDKLIPAKKVDQIYIDIFIKKIKNNEKISPVVVEKVGNKLVVVEEIANFEALKSLNQDVPIVYKGEDKIEGLTTIEKVYNKLRSTPLPSPEKSPPSPPVKIEKKETQEGRGVEIKTETTSDDIVLYRGAKDHTIDVSRPNGITGGVSFSLSKEVAERFASKVEGTVKEYKLKKGAKIVNHSDLEEAVKDVPLELKEKAVKKIIKENGIDAIRFDLPEKAKGEDEIRIVNDKAIEVVEKKEEKPKEKEINEIETLSGRKILLPPKIRGETDRKIVIDIKKINKWLVEQAIEEAKSRNDSFNLFRYEKLDPNKLTQGEIEEINYYLFGKRDYFEKTSEKIEKTEIKEEKPKIEEKPEERKVFITKEEYLKLSEREIGDIYHNWVKKNGFMPFVEWETKVLKGKIKIEKEKKIEKLTNKDIYAIVNSIKPVPFNETSTTIKFDFVADSRFVDKYEGKSVDEEINRLKNEFIKAAEKYGLEYKMSDIKEYTFPPEKEGESPTFQKRIEITITKPKYAEKGKIKIVSQHKVFKELDEKEIKKIEKLFPIVNKFNLKDKVDFDNNLLKLNSKEDESLLKKLIELDLIKITDEIKNRTDNILKKTRQIIKKEGITQKDFEKIISEKINDYYKNLKVEINDNFKKLKEIVNKENYPYSENLLKKVSENSIYEKYFHIFTIDGKEYVSNRFIIEEKENIDEKPFYGFFEKNIHAEISPETRSMKELLNPFLEKEYYPATIYKNDYVILMPADKSDFKILNLEYFSYLNNKYDNLSYFLSSNNKNVIIGLNDKGNKAGIMTIKNNFGLSLEDFKDVEFVKKEIKKEKEKPKIIEKPQKTKKIKVFKNNSAPEYKANENEMKAFEFLNILKLNEIDKIRETFFEDEAKIILDKKNYSFYKKLEEVELITKDFEKKQLIFTDLGKKVIPYLKNGIIFNENGLRLFPLKYFPLQKVNETKLYGRPGKFESDNKLLISTYEGKDVYTNGYILEFGKIDIDKYNYSGKVEEEMAKKIINKVLENKDKLVFFAVNNVYKDLNILLGKAKNNNKILGINYNFYSYFISKYPNVEFFVNLKSDNFYFEPILVKSNEKIVGVIMPMRLDYSEERIKILESVLKKIDFKDSFDIIENVYEAKKQISKIKEGESAFYDKVQNFRRENNIDFSINEIARDYFTSPLKLQFKKEGYFKFPSSEIRSPADIAFAFNELKNNAVESFYVIGLKNNKPVAIELISIGTINKALVDPKEITPILRKFNLDEVYLLHNHPSGEVNPSRDDVIMQRKINDGLKELGIKVKGQVIINTKEFGFIDENGKPHIYPLKTLIDKETNVPIYKKYIEWISDKPRNPVINNPKDVADLSKGLSVNWEQNSLVFILNTRNVVMGIEALPKNKVNDITSIIDALNKFRGNGIIIAEQGNDISIKDKEKYSHRFSILLAILNVDFIDVVKVDFDNNSYISLLQKGIISTYSSGWTPKNIQEQKSKYIFDLGKETAVKEEKPEYKIEEKKEKETDIDKIKTVEFPEILRIAKELLKGDTPIIKKLRERPSLGGSPLGVFRPEDKGSIILSPDAFKDPKTAARVLAHELGHLVDYLPDYTMKRGNVVGRIATLKKHLANIYGDLDNKVIKEELKTITKIWRPFDDNNPQSSYVKYRNSSKELYADAISVLFNDPALLKEKAPNFWKGFFDYLDRKPEVKDNFFKIWELLNKGEDEVYKERDKEVSEMFSKAEEKYTALHLEREMRKKDLLYNIKLLFDDINTPIKEKIKELEKQGVKIPPHLNPDYALKGLLYSDAEVKNFVDDNFGKVFNLSNEVDDGWEKLGKILFYERVINERGELANPLGYQPDTAQFNLNKLQAQETPENWEKLQKAKEMFREAVQKVVDLAAEDGYYSDEMINLMKANPSYATYQVIDYLDTYISSKVYHQVGTLKEIANPATATVMKAISTYKAIKRNKVKKVNLQFLKDYFKDEIKDAQLKWNGKTMEIKPPKNEFEGLVIVMEEGKPKGYYVDKDIADMLNYQNEKTLELLGELSRKVSASPFYRPLFTTYNIGFQTFNFVRDFQRAWKNYPQKSFADVPLSPFVDFVRILRNYGKAVKPAVKSAFGLKDELIKEMENANILGLSYNDIFGGKVEPEMKQIERIMEGYGLFSRPKKFKLLKPIINILDFVGKVGDTIERLPKVAAYIDLKPRFSQEEMPLLAEIIRTQIGSPAFRVKGKATPISNSIFLFSNAIKEGLKVDFQVATGKRGKKTASAFWYKTFLLNFLPKIILFAMVAGWLGDKIQKIVNNISEYDKTNYIVIPLGMDEKGKTIYMRIPQDETGRFLSGIFWKTLNLNKDSQGIVKSVMDIMSFGAGQLPNLSPAFVGWGALLSYLSGNNPYDYYRNRNIIPDQEFKAGWRRSLPIFMDWFIKNQGVGVMFPSYNPKNPTALEKVLSAPVISNILGRWIKVSDKGAREKLEAITQKEVQKKAERYLQIRETIDDMVKEYQKNPHPLTRQRLEKELIKKFYEKGMDEAEKTRLKKRLRIAIERGKDDPYINALINSTSNNEKAMVLVEIEKELGRASFIELVKSARKNGIISDDAVRLYKLKKSEK